jgi:tetratricopeptide (TPR) repeat protein
VAFTGGERALGKRKRFMRSGFLFITALSGLILLLVGFASGLVILLALAIVMACFEAALVNLKQWGISSFFSGEADTQTDQAHARAAKRRLAKDLWGSMNRKELERHYLPPSLAQVYVAQNRMSEAEMIYQKRVALADKSLQSDPAYLITVYDDLATFYILENRISEAKPVYERAILLTQTTSGSNDIRVAEKLDYYTSMLKARKQDVAASEMENQAARIRERAKKETIQSNSLWGCTAHYPESSTLHPTPSRKESALTSSALNAKVGRTSHGQDMQSSALFDAALELFGGNGCTFSRSGARRQLNSCQKVRRSQ